MADLSTLLSKIDTVAEKVDAVRPLDYETEQKVRQKLWLDWNYHSNAIEGNTLSLGETRAFLLHGITAQGKPFRDYLDIDGHRKAIEYLEEFIRQDEELTEAYIRELHRVLLVERYQTDALTADGRPTKRWVEVGQYKTVPNSVRTSTGAMHFYASPEETPARMGDLMVWYRDVTSKGTIHPVVLAASFHFRFVAIHPFDDGNGRMSRLLMNFMLMRHGLVPIIVPTDRKPEYILTLEQADAGEIEPFIAFIGEQVVESLELYLKAARGESIEDLSDLDKRVALLKQQLAQDESELILTHTLASQQVIYSDVIEPLFDTFTKKVQTIENLFSRSRSAIEYRGDLPSKPIEGSFISNRSQVEPIVLRNRLNELTTWYSLRELKANASIGFETRLSAVFERSLYKLKFAVRGSAISSQEFSYPYNTKPGVDELTGIIRDILTFILDKIEQQAERPKYD